MFNPRTGTSLIGIRNRSPVRSWAWKELYERPADERMTFVESEAGRRRLIDIPAAADESVAQLYLFGPECCAYERRPQDRLDRVAARHDERPVETVVRRLRETGGRQLFAAGGENQVAEHIEEVFRYRDTILGLGDAGAHVGSICDSSMTTHALSYWCRERGVLSREDAIRRLTSDPADAFGIARRGRLQPG